jgi:hypothetical protein
MKLTVTEFSAFRRNTLPGFAVDHDEKAFDREGV